MLLGGVGGTLEFPAVKSFCETTCGVAKTKFSLFYWPAIVAEFPVMMLLAYASSFTS